MPIRSSGALPITEIATEFGGSAPFSLDQFYRGGPRVINGPVQNANISTSGTIAFGMFYGAVRAFVFNQVISANTQNYNLRNAAVAAGWDQVLPLIATVTINSGVYVSANSTGLYAFDTGATSYPANSSLALINNGFIIGMGGNGGSSSGRSGLSANVAGSAGGNGGPAVRITLPTQITNNGTIGGGGGGGGGARTSYFVSGDGKNGYSYYIMRGGGGGGGRTGATNTGGGGVGPAGSYSPYYRGPYYAYPGGTGTASGAGGGGRGDGVNGTVDGGVGGGGGNWGSAGGSGSAGTSYVQTYYTSAGGPYGGGAGGACLVGNSFVTWVVTGTRLGAIS